MALSNIAFGFRRGGAEACVNYLSRLTLEEVTNMSTSRTSIEDRLRAVEDRLAIYHLIASHPPAADTGTDRYYRDAFTPDGEWISPGESGLSAMRILRTW
jgi:hypothetical protein